MVNFFAQQQQAKRNTSLLVLLFLLAFISIIGIVTAAVAVFSGAVIVSDTAPTQIFWQPLIITMAVVAGGILLVCLVKWLQLRPGGHVVAESLGGIQLAPDSSDPLERRVLNVVEEMAIAANLPVPAVYLLPNEAGINAFAAGYETKDAAIGLTRGAVETFSREQLQAVVAHEFSHILNGDMRLNIRLIAALAGILSLTHLGYMLLRSSRFSSRRNNKNALPLVGVALLVVGSIGVFFGQLIKAAVSRQREYLADAAAVQFTRNPEALAGALQQIGARQHGSRVHHSNADEASHLFFGQALSSWFTLMATHPPLAQRIKRLTPHWNGKYPSPQQHFSQTQQARQQQQRPNALEQLAKLALPVLLLEQARSPQQAPQLIRGLLEANVIGSVSPLAELSAAQQLALVELSIPALQLASTSSQLDIVKDLEHLAQRVANGGDLFHWCLYQLLARHLLPASKFKHTLANDQAFDITVAALTAAEQQQAIDFTQLERALNTCKSWSPQAKQTLVQRWYETIHADAKVSAVEHKLIATLCACIGAPLPDLEPDLEPE
ncbi:M48 family metallopeptidase [Pseudidiomarina sp. GXY010]|uniref:M48 family metallopeptidase n=3 Tax=Gammaproteobacteria TaxID=1236 RepID=A0ABU3KXZ5_9GAMM|nr:M48 family metallopeptidase [Pseudidiomarina sp. GXY010]MDT7526375.1 M48 family metallopeptidase [Pseudidiomarina sp. GXY010]